MNQLSYKEHRESAFKKEQTVFDSLVKKRKRLLEEVKSAEDEIVDQSRKLYRSECEWKHPYFDAFHSCLHLIELARVCLEYMVEDVCLICESIYVGSECVNCLIIGSENRIEYRTRGEMIFVNSFNNFRCYELTDHYDVEVISYWRECLRNIAKNQLNAGENKKAPEFRGTPFYYCKHENKIHLVLCISMINMLKTIKKGSKLSLFRGTQTSYSDINNTDLYRIYLCGD